MESSFGFPERKSGRNDFLTIKSRFFFAVLEDEDLPRDLSANFIEIVLSDACHYFQTVFFPVSNNIIIRA